MWRRGPNGHLRSGPDRHHCPNARSNNRPRGASPDDRSRGARANPNDPCPRGAACI